MRRYTWRLAAMFWAVLLGTATLAAEPEPVRRAQLARWLRDDCGACHGMTLKGGLGPPLTAAALADKPHESLIATVLSGRPGTPMPPWSPFITQDEAEWLIERLQAGNPPAVQPSASAGSGR
ncbi:MAG: cytochrome c [Betaproteobacteria bacterium]|nr:cytochrome c [Betaproteobacteria bacterium]